MRTNDPGSNGVSTKPIVVVFNVPQEYRFYKNVLQVDKLPYIVNMILLTVYFLKVSLTT